MARPGDVENNIRQLAKNPDDKFKKIFHLLYDGNQKLDVFGRYGVDCVFELRILSVDSKFRGQGVARKLIDASQLVAIKNGFTVFVFFIFYFSFLHTFFKFQSSSKERQLAFSPKRYWRPINSQQSARSDSIPNATLMVRQCFPLLRPTKVFALWLSKFQRNGW